MCPTALSRALEIRQKLGPDADKLQVIFISIDPERDTPELLGEYMRAFDPSFLGLRTDPKNTAQTAFNYKVFYRRVPSGSSYTMDHTAISYVLDTEGHAPGLETPADGRRVRAGHQDPDEIEIHLITIARK